MENSCEPLDALSLSVKVADRTSAKAASDCASSCCASAASRPEQPATTSAHAETRTSAKTCRMATRSACRRRRAITRKGEDLRAGEFQAYVPETGLALAERTHH